MVTESWFRNLWKAQKKHEGGPRPMMGILAFEVASLMSKLVYIWRSLSDEQIAKLRDGITNSIGIKKLISEDDDNNVHFISSEMIENLGHVAKAVAWLSNKCRDPCLKRFEHVFKDMVKTGEDPYSWTYTWKKMDRKSRKMERFILINSNLYKSMESLSDLVHTLGRMKANVEFNNAVFIEYEKKIAWKNQEVKQLKEFSLYNRSYDYVVRLLARSIFTVYRRIEFVFGLGPVVDYEIKDTIDMESNYYSRSQLLQSSVHPFVNNDLPRFSPSPMSKTNGASNFFSSPLGKSTVGLSPLKGEIESMSFYSGSSTRLKKTGFKLWPKPEAKSPISKHNCFENDSVMKDSHLAILEPKQKWLNAPPGTLGAASLALHYSNLIIFVEKLVTAPDLINVDTRDDLYNMLPSSVRYALKKRLRPVKRLSLWIYDSALAREWNKAMLEILEWLGPLAHNTMKWQTERSFEHQNMVLRTNVLLVQTLYFANQEKTEAIITELLVGLNYVWRNGRELNANASSRTVNSSFEAE